MVKVGYQGVRGAYSEIAVLKYFKGEADPVSYKGFKELIEAVEKGEVQYGMLPVENSTTGTVTKSVDLLKDYNINIVGEEYVKVEHNLIVLQQTLEEDIKEVYSHPEALKQCDELFETNQQMRPIAYIDTAKSVEYIKKENCKHKAAIASNRAAEIYNLKILKSNIQDNKYNTTRFLVISNSKKVIENGDKISLYLITSHKAGALFEVVKVFANNNINMLKIESRPIQNKPFEYCFYIDTEGNVQNSKTKQFLKELKKQCIELKVLGNYVSGKREEKL